LSRLAQDRVIEHFIVCGIATNRAQDQLSHSLKVRPELTAIALVPICASWFLRSYLYTASVPESEQQAAWHARLPRMEQVPREKPLSQATMSTIELASFHQFAVVHARPFSEGAWQDPEAHEEKDEDQHEPIRKGNSPGA